MGAPKRSRSANHGDKLTAKSVKLRKTGKQGEFRRMGKAIKADEKKHAIISEADESGKLYEEQVDGHSDGEEAELVANTKVTVYDSLLKKLGSSNVSVADELRRRKREEQGETDTDEDEDEDEDSDLESIDELEEKADDGDDDDEDDDGNN